MKYAFTHYNTVMPRSYIDFLTAEQFEKRWIENEDFRNEFPEERKRKEERRANNRN